MKDVNKEITSVKFSVLMSVYYKEKAEYLEQALSSIINQTIKPNEIIIVKDGKLGLDLEVVIDKYKNNYPNIFKILELKTNQGLGKALRYGVENSNYEIIARMDSDDIAREDRFEKQLSLMLEDKSLDIVGSIISEFENDIENVLAIRNVPITNEEIKKYSKKRNPFNHMTVMYKKQAVIDCGNYIDCLWNEDYYLWVRMIMNGCKMQNINESLVYARIGNDMFERRGGIKYALRDISLQVEYLKIGFINIYQCLFNILSRTFVRILPNKLRRILYIKLLRN